MIEACTTARRLRLAYRVGAAPSSMDVDPWAVVLRHSRWYLLGWSHTRQARRVLRVDRIGAPILQRAIATLGERLRQAAA
ncbi:MAG: WYL domain-containing protein [Micromonosporaceae bacterium]